MFGMFFPAQSYPAEGPAATIEFIPLNLCDADSYSLMPCRESVTLMACRNSYTLMPERESEVFCSVVAPPPLGSIRFNASPDHETLISYEVRIRDVTDLGTVVASQDIGLPTPAEDDTITVDLTALFNTLPTGVYNVTVAAIGPGGETDSGYSNNFSLPLA